jgi:hypothetical protein
LRGKKSSGLKVDNAAARRKREDGKSGGAKFGLGGVSTMDGRLFLMTLSSYFWQNYSTMLMSMGIAHEGCFASEVEGDEYSFGYVAM